MTRKISFGLGKDRVIHVHLELYFIVRFYDA